MALDVYKDWLGIPEGDRPPDHYELLRLVRFEDDPDKIRKHYKKLNGHVRKYATGQYATESQELLNELAKAMLCLTDAERKRDYDESLGREFATEDEGGRKPLGKVLVDQGKITREQMREAEQFASARGLTMRDAVVQMKLVDPESAAQALATELGLPYVDLPDMVPDDSVLDRVPRNVVKRNRILPLFEDDDTLLVACLDQPEHELEDEIRLRFNMPMRGVIATPLAINQGIAKYYAPGMRDSVEEMDAKGGKKSRKGGTAKAAVPRKPTSSLTEDEKHQRKLIGYLIIMWALIGGAMLDSFVIDDFLAANFPIPFCLTFILPPLAALWVFKSYLK